MPRSGGVYNPTSGFPFVNFTVADETVVNTLIDDIGDEITNSIARDGQSPATSNLPMATFRHTGVGDASARTHYAAAGQVQDDSLKVAGSVSGVDTITAALSPAITSYADGMVVSFTPAGSNTGAATIALNGLAAKSIVKFAATALVAGDLVATVKAYLLYNGTNFQLLNPQHHSLSGTFTGTLGVGEGTGGTSSGTITYTVLDGIVHLRANTGFGWSVSTTNTFTMTGLPVALRPSVARVVRCGGISDINASLGGCTVGTNGTFTFFLESLTAGKVTQNTTGFDATSWPKGLASGWNISYPL